MTAAVAPSSAALIAHGRWTGNPYRAALRRAVRKPLGLLSVIVLGGLLLAAVAAPLIAPAAPAEQFRGQELHSPSLSHPFGTDELGRDLLARTVYGLRVSLVAGVLAVAAGGTIGVLLGLLAGYRGGVAGAVMMRVVDGLIAFPTVLFGLALVAAFGPGLRNIMTAIAIVQIPIFARIARSAMLAELRRDYVLSAVALGAGDGRIIFGQILINALPPLLVQTALAMGFSVLLESSLSFLGIGIRPPNPSLGSILDGGRRFMREHHYYPLFPGAVLTLLLLGLNSLADTLNDALNPRSRR